MSDKKLKRLRIGWLCYRILVLAIIVSRLGDTMNMAVKALIVSVVLIESVLAARGVFRLIKTGFTWMVGRSRVTAARRMSLRESIHETFPMPTTKMARWTVRLFVVGQLARVLITGDVSVGTLRASLWVVIGVEVVFAVNLFTLLAAISRGFKRRRSEGDTTFGALNVAISDTLPMPEAALVTTELGQLHAILLRLRFRKDVPNCADGISYSSSIVPVGIVVSFVCMLEMSVVAILVPWSTVRSILLVGSLIAIYWAGGFIAAASAFPHTIDARRLRLRFGAMAEVSIPTERIDCAQRISLSGLSRKMTVADEDEVFTFRSGGSPNVLVQLREPTKLEARGVRSNRSRVPVRAIHFYADDPSSAVGSIQRILAAKVTVK